MGRRLESLTGETLSGVSVSFSYNAYADAMRLYSLKDIEAVVIQVEAEARKKSGVTCLLSKFGMTSTKATNVPEEVALFFRDFAIIQEFGHPDFDRGVAIGSLATRIELSLGLVPAEERTPEFYSELAGARRDYEQIFG